MLSPFWEKVSHFNPILYMVNALRYAMIGVQEINMTLAMAVICFSLLLLTAVNMLLLKKGIGLRE